jgi:aryl-alcohol dehydrogenase-like predicted oxidoreductase
MSFIKNGEQIKQIGYGAMVLEGYYGQSDDTQAIDTLVYAINNNMMIDSADAYGAGHNELLIKEAIKKADKEPFIATKFGIVYDESDVGTKIDTGWGFPLMINGRAEYVKKIYRPITTEIRCRKNRLDVCTLSRPRGPSRGDYRCYE